MSKPRRCKKKTVLSSLRRSFNCESTVALWKRAVRWSSTQRSRAVASAWDLKPGEQVSSVLLTFREVFLVFVVAPHLHFSGCRAARKHRQYVRGSK